MNKKQNKNKEKKEHMGKVVFFTEECIKQVTKGSKMPFFFSKNTASKRACALWQGSSNLLGTPKFIVTHIKLILTHIKITPKKQKTNLSSKIIITRIKITLHDL